MIWGKISSSSSIENKNFVFDKKIYPTIKSLWLSSEYVALSRNNMTPGSTNAKKKK